MSLLWLQNGKPTAKLALGPSSVIGRSSDCDLFIPDPELSRRHARLWADEPRSGYWLEDLGSLNGTFLAGARLTRAVKLRPGDEIRAGAQVFVFDPPADLFHPRQGGDTVILADDDVEIPPVPDRPVDELDSASWRQIFDLATRIAPETDLDRLLEQLLSGLMDLFQARRGCLAAVTSDGGFLPLAVRALEGDPVFSRTIFKKALAAKAPLRFDDALEDLRFDRGRSIQAHGLRSVIAAPLPADGRAVGCLQMDRPEKGAFSGKDLARLAALGPLIAGALTACRRLDRMERKEAAASPPPHGFVGRHPLVLELLAQAEKIAPTDARVLITGESGTGKELLARMIHQRSRRAGGPLVAVNCAAFPETMVESELFGHEKGAFTGADRLMKGRFEQADGGVLFLDEVGDLAPAAQVKLLRALQEGRFYRLGGERPVQVDVRVIAATNRDPEAMVRDGRFREDLYYRLNVIRLHAPALRDRPGDLIPLAEHFLEQFSRKMGKPAPKLSAEAAELIGKYAWPGNVRELANAVERMVVMGDGLEIRAGDLPAWLADRAPSAQSGLHQAVVDLEKRMIRQALETCGGKKIEAARALGLSRPTLDKKIKEYGL